MKLFSRDPAVIDPLAIHTTRVERFALFWKELHPLWKVLMIIGVLGILGIPFYRPAMRAQKLRNHETDLAAAKQALAEGRSVEARDLSLEVLRSDLQKNDALPIFMRAAAGAGDHRLTGAAREYLSLKTQDKTDRIFAWTVLCEQSPMGIAGMSWLSLRDDERADPDFLVPWLERLVTENLGQLVEVELAKQTTQTDPRLERIRLSMLAKRGTDVSFREIQARLLDRIATHPDDGPILLEVLDEIPQSALIPYSFTALGNWIQVRGGEPTGEDRMRLARCEIAAHPETTDAVLTRVTGAYAASDPLSVAKLYSALQRFDKAEELLEPTLPKGDPDTFQLMAEVLERLGKLDEWGKLLEHPPEGAFLPGVLCDRAFIASKRGDKRASTELEQEAMAAAELRSKSDSLIHLARHASRRGMSDYATNIWVKAIQRGPAAPLPFFLSIVHVVESIALSKKESQLFQILTVYRALEPGNLDVMIQYLYLGCLVGNVTPATLLSGLSPVREKISPDREKNRSRALDCTLAFGNLLEGHHELAAQLTGDSSIDWFTQAPAYQVIRAIALTKTGRKEEADIYLEDFAWDSLLPSETRVFRELLELPGESEEVKETKNAEKSEKARLAEEARQVQKAKELKEIREALEAKEAAQGEQLTPAEKVERAEKSRLAEQARQAKRNEELKAIREKLAARAAKEAEEAKKNGNPEAPGPR